jgi:RNA polymerase-binding transcription factor DksA
MDAIQSQQMALGLKARQQQQLLRVQNALKLRTNGTYGQCRRCNGPIAIECLESAARCRFLRFLRRADPTLN